jgi:hypothetical protein
MKWMFESDFLPGDHRLMAACKKQGYEVQLVDRYGKFSDVEAEPAVFRGGIHFYLSFSRKNEVRYKIVPGFYCTLSNYACSMYYPRFNRFILNRDYILLPYGSLPYSMDHVVKKLGYPFFIRPNSGAKLFPGQVVQKQEQIDDLRFNDSLKPETLILLSSAKEVNKEWRFVVCGRKIISGTLYKPHEEEDSESTNAGLFAESVINSTDWEPDPVWTLDICSVDGKMYVLEVNSFSCAGLYSCDASKVVEAVSKQARKDFQELYE